MGVPFHECRAILNVLVSHSLEIVQLFEGQASDLVTL